MDFLESRTQLAAKFNKYHELGYPSKNTVQSGIAYWEHFECQLCASGLFWEILDIFGAITQKRFKEYTDRIGHGVRYYKQVTSPADEFFAEYMSLCAVNEKLQLDVLNEVFPDTISEYNCVIEKLNFLYK